VNHSELRPASDYGWAYGAIIRGPRDEKRLALIFTGGDFGEGTGEVLDALKTHAGPGSFFFTGGYLRRESHRPYIRRMLDEGHYVGPHSDAHLLYCPWDDRERTLVTWEEFTRDLEANLDGLASLGVDREGIRWWIPPYEWYNRRIVDWSLGMGLRLFNFTPGTLSHADYTEDDAGNYRSSETIYRSIFDYEAKHPDGLSGFLLLTHVGASPRRSDKFYRRLGAMMGELADRGYAFVRVDALLRDAPLRPPPEGKGTTP